MRSCHCVDEQDSLYAYLLLCGYSTQDNVALIRGKWFHQRVRVRIGGASITHNTHLRNIKRYTMKGDHQRWRYCFLIT